MSGPYRESTKEKTEKAKPPLSHRLATAWLIVVAGVALVAVVVILLSPLISILGGTVHPALVPMGCVAWVLVFLYLTVVAGEKALS